MARVCVEWFPNPENPNLSGFFMDDFLKRELDIYLKNVKNDWDFTILISGQGEMRVGKSLIGLQICAYWTYQIEKLYGIKVPFNIKENLVLNGNELMKKGVALGEKYKYATLDYDEAADDLESSKVMKGSTQMIKDYLRKSAQFNMLNVIVQSEYFEVPKSIAISRACCLIDVYYDIKEDGKFERGHYNFYSRRQKKLLYLVGKKMLDYRCVKPDFKGTFNNFYPVDEQEYRKEKKDALNRWTKTTAKDVKQTEWVRAAILLLNKQGWSSIEVANHMNELSKCKISDRTIRLILQKAKTEEIYADDSESESEN
jgi:hypothetical protein